MPHNAWHFAMLAMYLQLRCYSSLGRNWDKSRVSPAAASVHREKRDRRSRNHTIVEAQIRKLRVQGRRRGHRGHALADQDVRRQLQLTWQRGRLRIQCTVDEYLAQARSAVPGNRDVMPVTVDDSVHALRLRLIERDIVGVADAE